MCQLVSPGQGEKPVGSVLRMKPTLNNEGFEKGDSKIRTFCKVVLKLKKVSLNDLCEVVSKEMRSFCMLLTRCIKDVSETMRSFPQRRFI